jgi:cytoskeletal protein RodZ
VFELGQMLKQARMEKGISIEDLQEATKIRKRYLEAIEEGNFKVLPGNFYVRAFIKSYAEAVGLDPGQVLGMYKNVIPTAAAEPVPETVLRRSRNKQKIVTARRGTWITGVILWAFLILILGILYYIFSSNYNKGNPSVNPADTGKHITGKTPGPIASGMGGGATVNPSASPTPTPTPTPTVTPTPTPAADVKLVQSKNTVDYYTVTGSGKISVNLEIISDQCWVSIYKIVNGSRVSIEPGKALNMGESRTFDSDQPIYLTLGRANSARLTVNNVQISVGDKPNPKRFQFDFDPSAGAPAGAGAANAAAGGSGGTH